MDPQSCAGCHPTQFAQWQGSMHAYATDDPVFVAMNARFVREQGKNDLCVRCHAPLAQRMGLTDGSDLSGIPANLHGVTCFFCHSVTSIAQDHNGGPVLADDDVIRGPIADPAPGAAHASMSSALHDLSTPDSSGLCGSCHDVQNGHGVDIERTFAEWKGSLYAQTNPTVFDSCGGCHMTASTGKAANVEGAPDRRIHDHSMAAVDVALTPFPDADGQKKAVQTLLDAAIVAKLCVDPPQGGPNVTVTLDNAFVGHAWPSGAAHDRRLWVELVGTAAGQTVYQSGVVPDGTDVTTLADPDLWLLREQLFDGAKAPALFLWDAQSKQEDFLQPAVTNDPQNPAYYHAVSRPYTLPPAVDDVKMRVRIVPIGLDVMNALVQSGDLDASLVAKMPTFTLSGTVLEWKKDAGYGCVP